MDVAEIIDEYLDSLKAEGRSEKTLEGAQGVLWRAHADLPFGLPTATRPEITKWLANDTWAPNTRLTYFCLLRPFYEWAADNWIDHDPMRGMKAPSKPPSIPRPAQADQARWAVAEAAEPHRLHCILAAYAGLRCCEIARLDRDHVQQTQLTVIGGKGGKDAFLPCHPMIWQAVKHLPGGPVTRTLRGPATPKWVSSSTNEYLHRNEITWTVHKLRHLYVTRAHKQTGGDVFKTQRLARHASAATTAGYVFINEDELSAAVAGIEL